MKIYKTIIAIVVLLLGTMVSAASVDWVFCFPSPPASWAITPSNPTTSDTITFSGPISNTPSNACQARVAFGGTPMLNIDNTNRLIRLYFQPPAPTICTMEYMPVCGLGGDFGPLSAGSWFFYCTDPNASFIHPFTVTAGGGSGNIIHVDKDSPAFIPNGSSWSTAYRYLQDALAIATSGDEIRVAEGEYKPDKGSGVTAGDREATFSLISGVAIKGAYGGYGTPDPDDRDLVTYPTTLSGDLLGNDWGPVWKDDNSYSVVTASNVDSSTILDGFNITAGYASGPFPFLYGGGMYISEGYPKIINCRFHNNVAVLGAGVTCFEASPDFGNCQINGNWAMVLGGALYNFDSDTDLTNCLITGNTANNADIVGGWAIYNIDGSLSLDNCTLADNRAAYTPSDRAITSFVFDVFPTQTISVVNSILYNGGNEIWSNNTSIVNVNTSNVQGGWTGSGSGNINVDPCFVDPGLWGIEGQWYEGDYRLDSDSLCIDAGNNSLLPADLTDLDYDGNTGETLPVDLDGETRVQDTTVDQGAYEQSGGSGPDPNYIWIPVTTVGIYTTTPPSGSCGFYTTLTGNHDTDVTFNFTGYIKAEAQAASAAGGTWTATLNPDPGAIGPGTTHVNFDILGVNVDLCQLPASTQVKVANVTFFARPAP